MRRGRILIGIIAVGLVLLLDAMAACPSLHELLHRDANAVGHQCVVTLFAHGQVDSAGVDISVAVPPASIETATPFKFSVFATAIENLPAGRAPPVSVSLPA